MTQLIGFRNHGSFIQFIEEMFAIPTWKDMKCWWPVTGELCYLIEIPRDATLSIPKEHAELVSQSAVGKCKATRLEDFWRRARPTARRATINASPVCWWIQIDQDDPSIYEYVIDRAPEGLELAEYEASNASNAQRLRGFFVFGVCGAAIANAPPIGCTAFECDDLPNGARAAFPRGWTKARIPEFLWPATSGAFVRYDGINSRTHHVTLFEQTRHSTPLGGLLASTSGTAERAGSALLASVKKVPWKVIRKPAVRARAEAPLAPGRTTPAVFRLRTRADEFGSLMLQVLDEAESRQVPEFNYSNRRWETPNSVEQWHFLHSDEVDGSLLSSWSSLERFDYVHELAEDDLHVFVACDSHVMPSFALVAASARDRGEVLSRIRTLVGNPPKGTIVLVEASDLNPDKPILTSIAIADTKKLGSVISEIVRDWNTNPPIHAIAKSTTSEQIQNWRDSVNQKLAEIAQDEQAELQRAATECCHTLETEAKRVLAQLEQGLIHVRDAGALAGELNSALVKGEVTFEGACSALAALSELLTKPRRAWIQEKTIATAEALGRLSPQTTEVKAVQGTLIESRTKLTDATKTLIDATYAVQSLEQSLNAAQTSSQQAVVASQARLREVEERAARVQETIGSDRTETGQRLERANAVHAEVQRVRGLLEVERAAVERLEAQSRALSASNEKSRVEFVGRRREAEETITRLERVRDVDIPQLQINARTAEDQLNALNQAAIESKLRALTVRVEEINARITDVERTRQQYQQLISKEQSVQRELETKTQDVDLLKRDLQTAKKKSTALSETSIASAQVARARKLLSEAMMIIDPESPLAEEPVTPSIWTRFNLFKRRL
jgi:hypothetical protein